MLAGLGMPELVMDARSGGRWQEGGGRREEGGGRREEGGGRREEGGGRREEGGGRREEGGGRREEGGGRRGGEGGGRREEDYIISQDDKTAFFRLSISCGISIPYSGKFSQGKNFAKARANVLQKKFTTFNFVQPGLGEIKIPT